MIFWQRNTKDKKKRANFNFFEKKKKVYKFLLENNNIDISIKKRISRNYYLLPRNSSFTRIRNRCILSGRSRAIFSKFKLSRSMFKKLANRGQLYGIKKHSW